MDAATKAKKDLESIETQIARLESIPGADIETKKQLYDLHRQVEARMVGDLGDPFLRRALRFGDRRRLAARIVDIGGNDRRRIHVETGPMAR